MNRPHVAAGSPAEPPAGDFPGLGQLGPAFRVKYGPGIPHNLCTTVGRELDEVRRAAGVGARCRRGGRSSLPRAGEEPERDHDVVPQQHVFCLCFHLRTSDLLAQLAATINLQLQLTACTGLKMVIKVFAALSPSLVAQPGPRSCT